MERYVELGGQGYRLRYTVNAMCEIEEKAGVPLDALLKNQFSAARLLLWGGLIELQPGVTRAEAGRILDRELAAGGTLDGVIAACADAMRDAGFFGPEAE